MPEPKPSETKQEFIERFMSSEEAKKDYPDEDQRYAVAESKWKEKSKNKEVLNYFSLVKRKEVEDEDEEAVYTFIGASTLPDRSSAYLPDGTKIEGEILSKNVLDRFAEYINDESKMGGKYGSYRTISLFHNRVRNNDYTLEEAGYVVPGSARVEELEKYPGNYGLFVDVKTNKMYNPPMEYNDYTPEKIEYKIENGALGLSLEYNNSPDQERIVDTKEGVYRYIMDSNDFRGFGFARPDLIGNPTAVRVKEIDEGDFMSDEPNAQAQDDQLKKQLDEANAKIKELEGQMADAKKEGSEAKTKELQNNIEEMNAKIKEMKLQNDQTAAKLKESIELAFSGLNFNKPGREPEKSNAKIKEVYGAADSKDWVKFKELSNSRIEENEESFSKFKEQFAIDGPGFNFEKHQTLQVKCKGSDFVVIPSPKTKDVIDSGDMAESTYYQTNAMFADRYVGEITETFLKEDNLLSAMNKIQHIGGNDKVQWRIWVDYGDVDGDNTAAVDPDVTAVSTTQRDFIKVETPIREYRDAVEVTDFTQAHSMSAVGDLLGQELQRAAEFVVESMDADLFKGKTDATAGWKGFIGLLGVADSSTYGTIYGKTRTAANRLLDSTTANTYDSTSESISTDLLREGYNKVLKHGSRAQDIAIVMHPIQFQALLDSEEAQIRHNSLPMQAAPAQFGFNISALPYLDGIVPIIRDYRCESSSGAEDMFAVVDLSPSKGFNLVVSKPLGARGLAKVGTSEKAYVNFWGAAVYKSPRNVFVHDSLN